jgi:8-oxo-dGTP pyrophosphatase MutT (NUDIX family)
MLENQLVKLSETLKKAPDILGKKSKYRNAAVMITLCYLKGDWYLLFEKRKKSIPQGGEICFPGGTFDPTADTFIKDTAVRETAEELGIRPEQVRILGRLDTLVAAMGTTVDPFVGKLEIKGLEDLNHHKEEVEELFLLPLGWFQENKPEIYDIRIQIVPENLPSAELGLPEKYHTPWEGQTQNVYVYRTEKGIIWGITAELIVELISLLG